MRRVTRGFTLIELMIVIAIIAIVAAIAIPNLIAARLSANETAAIATLRNVVAAEAQFKQSAKVDTDGDGAGEYGGFAEMSGGIAGRMAAVLTPPSSRARSGCSTPMAKSASPTTSSASIAPAPQASASANRRPASRPPS